MALTEYWFVPLFFFVVATLYSSVGFGGGSGYLAILSQISPDQVFIRTNAYFCNLLVTVQNTLQHRKAKWLNWSDTWPWLICSIPMSYIGGAFRLQDRKFYLLLGVLLLIAAVLVFIRDRFSFKPVRLFDVMFAKLVVGAVIGLCAGLVGIGGGIFLSPILHLSKWRSPERIASISTLFILFNAAAGASGFFIHQPVQIDWQFSVVLMGAVLIGSRLGASFSLSPLGRKMIRYTTGGLVLLVGLRLLFTHF